MRAMLLCAGLSTRLGRIGSVLPKPLLPVCGLPILSYGIANLVAHGITDLVINTHHLPEQFEREIGDGRRWGARIRYLHEATLLGTGGGLKHALPLLDPDDTDEPFLSLNGKLIFDLDLAAVVATYRAAAALGPLLGMMVVRAVPDARDWGAIQVRCDARGLYVADMLADGGHMFCGVHITRPSVMARLPHGEADSIRQGYLPWLRAGERVGVYEHATGYFAEHSTPERYVYSNWDLVGGAALRHPPGRLSGVDPTARIHPTATLVEPLKIGAGAEIGADVTVGPHAIIGDGAIIRASVARTVVWANAVVDSPPSGPIVTGSPSA
jgi:NDP-sugar pyrophosphorylase family protein